MDNIVTNLSAKFNYDRMRNEKVFGNQKSDNNKKSKNNNNNNNVRRHIGTRFRVQ